MNISKRDQRLLLMLLGIFVFLFTYLTICNSYNAKKEIIQSEINSLEPRLSVLRGYYENLSTYKSGISDIEDSVSTELSKFPSDVRSEDLIMFSNEMGNNLDINIHNIKVLTPELISQFKIPQESSEGYALVPAAALRTGVVIDCDMNYEQLKELINYIYSTKHRSALKSVNVSFNPETGRLMASVSVDKFFISSANYNYKETNIPIVEKGTTDPFGTFSVSSGNSGVESTSEGEEN